MPDEQNEFAAVAGEFRKFSDEMKNPVVVGALLHRLSEERSSSNLVLKEINAKLDRLLALEARIGELEKRFDLGSVGAAGAEVMLPEVDENIVAFVRSQKRACAEEVQRHFNYRGRNAASSRLNRLVQLGVLAKNQVGKKMYFIALNPHSSAMK